MQLVQHDGELPERYQLQYRILSLRSATRSGGSVRPSGRDIPAVELSANSAAVPHVDADLPSQHRPARHLHRRPLEAGETLPSIVARIGEMIAYQSYNTKSPLNGEAARWVDQNLDRLPLDAVIMDVEEAPNRLVRHQHRHRRCG